jgi:hypothetical protein
MDQTSGGGVIGGPDGDNSVTQVVVSGNSQPGILGAKRKWWPRAKG